MVTPPLAFGSDSIKDTHSQDGITLDLLTFAEISSMPPLFIDSRSIFHIMVACQSMVPYHNSSFGPSEGASRIARTLIIETATLIVGNVCEISITRTTGREDKAAGCVELVMRRSVAKLLGL